MIVFFNTIQALDKPCRWCQYVHVWIKAGKAIPRADKQRAPNKEMNSSRFGIATAKRTKNRNMLYCNY